MDRTTLGAFLLGLVVSFVATYAALRPLLLPPSLPAPGRGGAMVVVTTNQDQRSSWRLQGGQQENGWQTYHLSFRHQRDIDRWFDRCFFPSLDALSN
jgi:hypothetical protein